MILTLGLLSIAQVCFIPGAIIYRLLIGRSSIQESLPVSFALSLVFNWVVVFYSAKFGFFNLHTLCLILVIEFFIGFLFFIKDNNVSVVNHPTINNETNFNIRTYSFIVLALTLIVVLPKVGHVFIESDAVLSWNRWATIWATNVIPVDTYHYPQLLPANYAISYVLTGNSTLQVFSYAECLFFFPLACLAFFNLAETIGDNRVHLANIIFFIFITLSGNITNGYADTPVACMTVISICIFIFGWRETNQNPQKGLRLILLSALVAAGAAATKQAGIFYALINVIGVMVWLRTFSYASKAKRLFLMVCTILINIVIAVCWYVQAQHNINLGLNTSEIDYVTNSIYKGQPYMARFTQALLHRPSYFILAIISLPALKLKGYKWATISGIVFLIIWALFFSYDTRNFALGIPLLAIGAGASCVSLAKWLPKIKVNPHFIVLTRPINKLVFAVLPIIVFSSLIPDHLLIQLQNLQQEKVGIEQYNKALYRAFEKYGEGSVISNDGLMPYASHMPKNVLFYYDFYNHSVHNELLFIELLSEPSLRYIIVAPKVLSPNLKSLIQKMQNDKKIILIENIKMKHNNFHSIYLKNGK